MIKGFENITYELDEYEEKVLLPVFLEGLNHRHGKSKIITSTEIIQKMRDFKEKYKISGPRVRKLIHHIRENRLIKRLIATSKGYYVTNDTEELRDAIKSLQQRENSIKSVRIALQLDLNELE